MRDTGGALSFSTPMSPLRKYLVGVVLIFASWGLCVSPAGGILAAQAPSTPPSPAPQQPQNPKKTPPTPPSSNGKIQLQNPGGVLPCLARSRCQETRAATN